MRRISLRRKNNRRKVRRRPINVLASAVTIAGLYFGIASIFHAIDQNYKDAAYFIILAMLCDILDGTVAKLTHSVSEFGKELDSLCDLVSFGAAPAVLIYTAYLAAERASGSLMARTGAVFAIIFVICGALRLARFNVYQSEIRAYFVGLPLPGAAAAVATGVLFTHYFEMRVACWVLGPLTLGLSYLMISSLRYPKDKAKALILSPKHAFRMLALIAVGLAVFHMAYQRSPAIMLFPLAAAYCLSGVADWAYRLMTHDRAAQEAGPAQAEVPPEEPPPTKTGDVL